jgi:signal transduction histidine kinase
MVWWRPSKELLSSLHDDTRHLSRWVEDLLDLARAEAASTTLRREPVDMHSWLDDVMKTYAAGFCRTFDFTLTAANTGVGVHETDLPYLFEHFYRTDKARTRDKGGAGIALAIVEQLVAAHGGGVGAQSSGNETAVWFSVPR